MSISNTVRALLNLCGKRQSDLVTALDMKNVQSLNNKFYNERWSASDLAAVAEACGAKLAFILPDGERVLISAADPVQAGQGVPGGCFGGSAGGLVSPLSTDSEEKPLTD